MRRVGTKPGGSLYSGRLAIGQPRSCCQSLIANPQVLCILLTSVTSERKAMSSYQEKIHRIIGNTIAATVPLALWTGLRDSVQWAYAEAHDSAKHDTRIVELQRRFKA